MNFKMSLQNFYSVHAWTHKGIVLPRFSKTIVVIFGRVCGCTMDHSFLYIFSTLPKKIDEGLLPLAPPCCRGQEDVCEARSPRGEFREYIKKGAIAHWGVLHICTQYIYTWVDILRYIQQKLSMTDLKWQPKYKLIYQFIRYTIADLVESKSM